MDGLGQRMFLAHNELERRVGRKVPYSELGKLIARQEGRLSTKGALLPYSGGNVLRWEQEAKRPSLEALNALAELTGIRKGWLAFGEGEMYPSAEGEARTNGTPPRPLVLEPLAGRGLKKLAAAKRAPKPAAPSHKKGHTPGKRAR